MSICWICGSKADSREHRIKASDLRKVFGKVDQARPLYTRENGVSRKTMQSVKSTYAKFPPSICHICNTTRTKPYDMAWDTLSSYLLARQDRLINMERLNLGKIFRGHTKEGVLNCHLYLMKVFGCMIIENKVNLDVQDFAECIKDGKAHNNFYFAIDKHSALKNRSSAGTSYIQAIETNGTKNVVYASCYYIIGRVPIRILYYVSEPNPMIHGKMIHPNKSSKIVKICNKG